MSTKIYNGYRLPKKEAQDIVPYIRDEVAPVLRDALKEVFSKAYLDKLAYTRANLFERACTIKKGGIRDPLADFEIALTLFPRKDDMLCIMYCEHSAVLKAFENIAGISYYGYWNNVDPEEGISDKDWEARGKDWDKAILGGIPDLGGLAITVKHHYPFTVKEIFGE